MRLSALLKYCGTSRAVKMAGSRGAFTLVLNVLLFQIAFSNPVNISPERVPLSLVQRGINYLNENSPTGHTYRGGNLISAQKLLEPGSDVYRLTLNLDPVCDEGSTNCPREACAIDLKDRSGEIVIDRSSIQCMYLYPQSAQEDVQQTESIVQVENSASDNAEEAKTDSRNTLQLDHEVEAAADSEKPETDSPDKPFIAVRASNSNYCPGCPYELNPNLPGLAAFGVQALDVMDAQGHNDFKHKLIRIIKVTRAVPPGSNLVKYNLLAEIAETNCLKTTLIERSECSLQANAPLRVCLITFEERPWQQSDRQVVGNNCTQPSSDLDNEINASLNSGLNGNTHIVQGNGQPERVDSVQEVIGKTAHIDQLAQEGKIGTYDSLIDQILKSPASDVTPETNPTEVPYFEGILPGENVEPYPSTRRDAVQQTNQERPTVAESPFVKVELERDENRQPFNGFVDKQKEFDEFLKDFDIPLRDTVVAVTEENRKPVTEEIIRAQKVGEERVAENGADSSEEDDDSSAESAENGDNCQRTKRSLRKTSPSEITLVKELAQKAVNTLDDIDKDNEKRVVRRILDSKKQKVDGLHYYLVIEVVLTDCREGDDNQNDRDCLEGTEGSTRICKVQIHTDEIDPLLSARVVKSECAKEPVKGKHLRNRRASPAPGSPRPISVDDPEIQNYTRMAISQYSETAEGPNEPILVTIDSATSQVVAGSLYKINITIGTSDCPKGTKENCKLQSCSEKKKCQVKVWSRPWLSEDGLQITINCSAEQTRVKRNLDENVGIVGASSEISVDNEDIKTFVNQGVHKYSQTLEAPNEPILVKIKSATSQVVAGTSYKINITLGVSDCPKGEKGNCKLQADSETKECQVSVWSRPWLPEEGLQITMTCDDDAREKRSLREKIIRNKRTVGGSMSVDIDDADVVRYAGLGVKKYSQASEGQNEQILERIISAYRQVVQGISYKIRVRLGPSNCAKGTTENCQLQANGEKKECEITAWSRPWLAQDSLKIETNCNLQSRTKRSLKGKNYSQKMLQQSNYLKTERLFNDFVVKYNKSYSSTLERKNRLKIFQQNMMMVQELQRNEQGSAVYGASIFADLTTQEFKRNYLGLKPELRLDNEIPIPMAEIPEIEIPREYDWRDYNVVTPVKNQGSCGSCWAFSVTGNVEGQYALRHRTLLSFSEQELVDCDTLDQGCNGGLPDNAYRAIEKLGGLELESDYPYDGENEACHFNKTEAKARVVSAVNITSNETQMAQWLVQNGPISIGINANAMQFYMGGVSHPFKFLCSPDNLDHGVLIVGYGIHTYPIFHKTLPYWTIKNSWGPGWGEQGYYRVYRGDGTCGVNQMASSAIVA